MHPRGCTRAALAEPAVQETEGGCRGFGRLLTLPLWYPAGGLPSLSPACLFTLAYFLPPSPQPPSPPGKGENITLFRRGLPPPAPLQPGETRHWFFLWKAGSFGYHSGARDSKPCRLGCGTGKQCRQPRRGGTGGEELRRLRWSSPPGLGEPVPHRVQPPFAHHSGRANKCRRGASPHCVFHSGRDSRYRRRQKPTPLPSFPFPQQSPHKENHAVDERREENRQNNMRENTEPEKADRRNSTRRESRGKHAE